MTPVPIFRRVMYVGLSVTDVRRSADWYRSTLGMETDRENIGGATWPSSWDEVLLVHPGSGLRIGLLQHPSNDGSAFSEFRTGLDHVEFEVGTMRELAAWRQHLDGLGIPYSSARPHIVTFRDPDNIQLELLCPSGAS
jgi:catechol 2,3-dioxygenase-like lactoylglutathione lyase family enzyme